MAARLITAGRLAVDDRYLVRLAAVARPPVAPHPLLEQSDEVTVEEQPFPLVRQSLGNWGIGPETIGNAHSERPVFASRHVVDQAIEAAIDYGNQEVGTLLLGHLVCDPALLEAGKKTSWCIVVTEHVRIPTGEGTPTSFVFPPDSFRSARQLADLRGRNEQTIGSQHSHGWRCHECDQHCQIRNLFFSTDDVRMAEQFPVYAAFLVIGGDPDADRDRPVARLYVRRRGVMQSLPLAIFD